MQKKQHVVVQEPPLQELRKQRSCVKRACITSSGCLIFFVIFFFIFIRFFVLSYPKTLPVVPTTVSQNIPMYHQGDTDSIRFVSGKKKANMLDKIAFVPKIVISPILFGHELYTRRKQYTEPLATSQREAWKNLLVAIETSVVDSRDTYKLTWKDEKATPEFIFGFYETTLKEKGFYISEKHITRDKSTLTFQNKKTIGTLTIIDRPQQKGTDQIILTIITP